jgi:hypothetical protein
MMVQADPFFEKLKGTESGFAEQLVAVQRPVRRRRLRANTA